MPRKRNLNGAETAHTPNQPFPLAAANIFKKPLWNKLKADFLQSPGKGQWEIAI